MEMNLQRSMEDAAEDGIRTRMILNSEIPVTGIPMTTGMTAEMTDMIAASRSYEANSQVIQGARQMFMKTLEIGRMA